MKKSNKSQSNKVLIRSITAGVFYGTPVDYDAANGIVQLKDCRRIWYWSGAATLNQLATEGTSDPDNCKFSVAVSSMTISGVAEYIVCTEDAAKSIEEVKVWRI
jgi:hypothetical protein